MFLWQVSMSLTLGWETAPEQVIENDFSQEANLLGEKKYFFHKLEIIGIVLQQRSSKVVGKRSLKNYRLGTCTYRPLH